MTIEYEQQSITGICPLCSKIPSRYGGEIIQERIFVTNAQNPDKSCCSKCPYSCLTSSIQVKGGTS